MKHKVVITQPIPNDGIEKLFNDDNCDVIENKKDEILPRTKLKQMVKGANAIIPLLTDKIDGEIMDAAGSDLKIIASYSVGYEHINLRDATNRGIAVTNTPDVASTAVAEHAMALMFAASKYIVEADAFVRSYKYKHWDPDLFLGVELSGKTLGIVGCGSIGNTVARNCYHGLGMKILYCDIKKNYDLEKSTHAYHVSLNQLLKISDVVSIHVPLLPSTKHLIGAKELDTMKDGAIIINTARGGVVDEKALVNALKNKKLFAAGLDVYENEPNFASGLLKLNNVVLTPHTASSTHRARREMGEIVVKNVEAALDGKIPPCLINSDVKDNFEEES